MKRLITLLLFLFLGLCANAQYENHWTPDPYQYPNNMTIVGVITINGVELRSQSIELGAFCNDECRGSVLVKYEEIFDRYYFYLMIYGEQNDEISFRCYDHNVNKELNLIQETFIDFQTNAMIGGGVDPFVFSFQTYQFDISLDVFPEYGGNVIGDGTYNQYDTCFLEFIPASDYQFDALLENGDTITKQNHYSFIVMSDRHFEAYFVNVDAISENDDAHFMIYPNPASDFVIIENIIEGQCDVTVYDMSGKIVLKENIDDSKLDVSNIPNGTYIVTIENDFHKIMHYKLCVKH